jgi:hypothetical protein
MSVLCAYTDYDLSGVASCRGISIPRQLAPKALNGLVTVSNEVSFNQTVISGSLSPRHLESCGCGWRRPAPNVRVPAVIFDKHVIVALCTKMCLGVYLKQLSFCSNKF